MYSKPVLSAEDVPKIMRCPHILSGYRPLGMTWGDVRMGLSFQSTVERSRRTFSKANCSATSGEHLREQTVSDEVSWKRQAAEHSFWTRSATCHCCFKPSFYEFFKNES